MKDKFYLFETKGSSMHPEIESNNYFIAEKALPTKLIFFDIAVYIKNNKFFAHRILYKGKNYFITKGNNLFKFEKISYHQIFGKVILIYRNNKLYNPNRNKIFFTLYSLLFR